MSRHPVADDGGELPDLHVETPIFPWSETNRVFIEPNLGMFRPGIEATIDTRLGKGIEMRTELRIEKQTESRIEERFLIRQYESRGRLIDPITFEVDQTTEPQAHVAIKCAYFQMLVDLLNKIVCSWNNVDKGREKSGGQRKPDRFHAICNAVTMASRSAGIRIGLLVSTSTQGNSSFSWKRPKPVSKMTGVCGATCLIAAAI